MRKIVSTMGFLLLASTLTANPAQAAERDCGPGSGSGGGLSGVGLTSDQRLICFNTRRPGFAVNRGEVSGLNGDTRLVGIDFRPADGELYGLGDRGGVYVIDTRNARATFKAQLNVALAGAAFDIDFNPTVDRLRIISDTGQNLRANVDDGATTTDTNLAGPDPVTGMAGAAYTNNDANPNTGTTLYGIDSRLDQLVIQAPPNAGTINATGKLTVDTTSNVGFDIYSRLNGGPTVGVEAFASLESNGRSGLYWINLFTGRAVLQGPFRARDRVVDIAIFPNQGRGGSDD